MPETVLDLVGVGFGPSNLAVALALDEAGATAGCDALFLERQPAFGWHTGMLLDEATMQVSFLEDLVTMRKPASPHSYLCYLRDRGRLAAFINQKSLFPLRTEFHDYLAWCAERVGHLVRYGAQVVDIRPVSGPDGAVDLLDVVVHRDGAEEVHRTRNVVIAAGLQPWLPDGIERSDQVRRSLELLYRLPELEPVAPRSLTVVGAGQSAAEAMAHLHGRFTEAEVRAVFGRYGYSPADHSPFANQILRPRRRRRVLRGARARPPPAGRLPPQHRLRGRGPRTDPGPVRAVLPGAGAGHPAAAGHDERQPARLAVRHAPARDLPADRRARGDRVAERRHAQHATLVFQGSNAYVSAPSTSRPRPPPPGSSRPPTSRAASIRCPLEGSLDVVRWTVAAFEAEHGLGWDPGPSLDYFDKIVDGVGAFRFTVESVDTMHKLSQEQAYCTRDKVVAHFAAGPVGLRREVSHLMRTAAPTATTGE